jgi:hypothetical protein
MTRGRVDRRVVVAVVLAAALMLGASAQVARAGEFRVGTCQADSLNFSTQAFEDFETRGMQVQRGCDPEGPGLRGLVTSNHFAANRVPRGARAIVTLTAPFGTRFVSFRWAGTLRRRDCGYALQLYADAPDVRAVSIKNVRANVGCPRSGVGQAAGYRSRSYSIDGATRIVQRVICVGAGGQRSCSARGLNYIQTYKASVTIADLLAPTVGAVQDTPLAQGQWVSGTQPLDYDASDNVGVRVARAISAGQPQAVDARRCVYADQGTTYADRVPCPNGRGQMTVDTTRLPEGTQPLQVQAEDPAGNVGVSDPVVVRIDNTPPGRVDVGVAGGEGWRNSNDFALSWANPAEGDRAPITAARYKLCPTGGGSCVSDEKDAQDISGFHVGVPAPGEWKLSLWRRDAAGNADEQAASVPVALRYDPEPPQLGFEATSADDPTMVAVQVTDRVSGLADGVIEISRQGSDSWQVLDTHKDGSRLVARIDDTALPAGTYALRARAYDQARNEGSTDRRLDGQPMVVTLPLRVATGLQTGVVEARTVLRRSGRRGHRRWVRRRVSVLAASGRSAVGGRVPIAGRLTAANGQGIAGAQVQVFASTPISADQLVAVLQTDGNGSYRYVARAATTRTLRFVYAGSAVLLPAQGEVRLLVAAASSLRVVPRRVLNGQAVTFGGRLGTLPVPAGGKLVVMQVLLSGRWQTFAAVRSDAAGRWVLRYRFQRTRGLQRYRFRARVPSEPDYPFQAGASRTVSVLVRGPGG